MSVPGGGHASIVVHAGCAGSRPRPENRAAGRIGSGATGGESMIGRRQFLAAAATHRRDARLPAAGLGAEPGGGAEAAPLPRAEVAGADEDAGALGGGDPGRLGRPGEDRDLSVDVARRLAAAAVPAGRRRGRRHHLDGERLHARACSRARRSSSCRRSSPTTSRRRTWRCATCSTSSWRRSSRTCTCCSCTCTPARRCRWPRSWCGRPTTPGAEAARAGPDRQRRRRGDGRDAGDDAGARPAAGAVDERGRRGADPLGDHPGAAALRDDAVPDRGAEPDTASAPRPSRCR